MPKFIPQGRRFKPGQSGNPSGRPKLPDDLRKIKEFTTEEVRRIIAKYLRLTALQLSNIVSNPETPMIDKIICSILDNADKNGDYSRVNFLLDRSIGKVKDSVEVDMSVSQLSKEEALRLGKEAVKVLEKIKE